MAFTVQIINTENNVNNILLTDDLTIEILKVRYNWILNASVRNAVLGLDDYGLVWYMGEWICGEWEDGTWYSGIWHDGTWKNGRWYSYLLDKGMILTKRFVILEEDKMYSQFLNGKWLNGQWNNGIFGNDNNVSGMTSIQITNNLVPCPYWYNGNFYNGLFENSVWRSGVWFGGSFFNSYWMNGKWYDGTLDNYEWWNGVFFGGDFVQGDWRNGTFNQLKTDISARFGTLTGTTTLSVWENGLFENGQFMSGLNLDDSGNTIASVYHNVSHWKNGTFNNGNWWGGHFEKGTFNYGNWWGGIFNISIGSTFTTQTMWKNGLWYDGLWLNGVFKSGMFFSGMWMDGVFENGFLVSEYQGTFSNDLKTNVVPQILPPPPPPPAYFVPAVTTDSTANVTYNKCDVSCTVTSDGGLATVRGVCYSNTPNPILSNSVFFDSGIGVGSYTDTIIGLNQNTIYYFRAFAENSLGVSYGVQKSITTSTTMAPTVITVGCSQIGNTALLLGSVTNGGVLTQYGFKYSLTQGGVQTGTDVPVGSGTAPISYSATIGPLNWNTWYYYAAYATNGIGTTYGTVKSFHTYDYTPD